jgi:hypothetical protein
MLMIVEASFCTIAAHNVSQPAPLRRYAAQGCSPPPTRLSNETRDVADWHKTSAAAVRLDVGNWGMNRRRVGVSKMTQVTDAVEKGFSGVGRIFSEALAPWSENDVGGHIISPISNQRPS